MPAPPIRVLYYSQKIHVRARADVGLELVLSNSRRRRCLRLLLSSSALLAAMPLGLALITTKDRVPCLLLR